MDKIEKIDRFYVEQFAYFMNKMKSIKEPDGRDLLESSMIVFGGGISDADRHDHDNLPVVLAGKGNGQASGGPPSENPKQQVPMTNLYLSLLDCVDAKCDSLGDSTGRFDLI